MDQLFLHTTEKTEYCASCRQQLVKTPHATLHVGIFCMPFCADCFEKFQTLVAKGPKKEEVRL